MTDDFHNLRCNWETEEGTYKGGSADAVHARSARTKRLEIRARSFELFTLGYVGTWTLYLLLFAFIKNVLEFFDNYIMIVYNLNTQTLKKFHVINKFERYSYISQVDK